MDTEIKLSEKVENAINEYQCPGCSVGPYLKHGCLSYKKRGWDFWISHSYTIPDDRALRFCTHAFPYGISPLLFQQGSISYQSSKA